MPDSCAFRAVAVGRSPLCAVKLSKSSDLFLLHFLPLEMAENLGTLSFRTVVKA
jgi:hypothetical protein